MLGLGHRMIEENPQPRSSMGMSMRGSDPMVAYDTSRTVTRIGLQQSADEIERTLTLLRRKAAD